MNTTAIRQQLHQFIETADDNNINELYDYVENSKGGKYTCSPNELKELHDRAEKCVNGTATLFTVEEAHNYIRSSRKK